MKSKTAESSKKTNLQKAQHAAKNPAHDPFARIHALPPELQTELLEMLRRDSPYDIAKIVQEEWGHCCDISPVTLAHQLEKYRSAMIPQEEMLNPFVVKRMRERYTRNVNVFCELANLVELQADRVRQARLGEIEAGTLQPETNRQIHLLARVLKVYGDCGFRAGLLTDFERNFRQMLALDHSDHYQETWKVQEHVVRGLIQQFPSLLDSLTQQSQSS